MSPHPAHRRLAQLGGRRRRHNEAGAQLNADIEEALRDALAAGVPAAWCAAALGMDRSTLYRTHRAVVVQHPRRAAAGP